MSNLYAGHAKAEITPPVGVCLCGYFFERRNEGVLDPLYVHALAFRADENAAVVLALDLCMVDTKTLQNWMGQVAQAAGLPLEAVLVHCTHTHTGPSAGIGRDPSDPEYEAWLVQRMCRTAVEALQDCAPVVQTLAYEGPCKGVTFSRRLKMKDGRYQTWGKTCDPEIESFAGPIDENVRFVRFVRENADEIVVVNFQAHPDNVSGNLCSADYPGFLRTAVETGRPGTRCVFFNGADGELIVWDYKDHSINLPKYVAAQWAGNKLGEFVLTHMDEAQPITGEGVSFGTAWLTSRTKRDPAKVAEAERIIHIHEHGDEEAEIGPDWIATPLVAEAYHLRTLDELDLDYIDIPIGAVAAGGLAFLGIAGEPFSQLGIRMRIESPYAVTFVCCKANGNEGYYPTAEAYDQGGYEPRNTRYPKGIGEALAQGSIDLLHRIHGA